MKDESPRFKTAGRRTPRFFENSVHTSVCVSVAEASGLNKRPQFQAGSVNDLSINSRTTAS